MLGYINKLLERTMFRGSPIAHVAKADEPIIYNYIPMMIKHITPFEIGRSLHCEFRTAFIIFSNSSHEYRIVEVGEVS